MKTRGLSTLEAKRPSHAEADFREVGRSVYDNDHNEDNAKVTSIFKVAPLSATRPKKNVIILADMSHLDQESWEVAKDWDDLFY